MNRTLPAIGALVFCIWAVTAEGGKVSSEDLERWAAEMGDRDFTTREKATRELWMAGSAAMRVLDPAARDRQNPERMLRARDLIRKIRFELTPETDVAVVEWVEEYEKAGITDKIRILDQMRKKRAYIPMLRLYAEEKDEKDKQKMAPKLEGVAELAARESLAAGNLERAETALNLAPSNLRTMVSRAVLLRLRGGLEAEWEGLDEAQRKGSWGLAVARVMGNLEEARIAAAALDQAELAAAFAVLQGDPTAWIRLRQGSSNEMETQYAKLAVRLWNGEVLEEDDFSLLAKHAEGAVGTSRFSATQMLFLLARNELAEPAMADHSPLHAFQYFEQLERIPEALAALGLDPRKPDYKEWFEKTMSQFRKVDLRNQGGISHVDDELVEVAGFLERRGLHKELEEAFSGPFLEYGKEEQFEFLDFLSMLLGSGGQTNSAPGFAVKVAERWVGDEPERWEEILTNVFGDSEETLGWWKRIGEMEPGMSRADRFRVLLSLFRIGLDPGNLRGQWLERLVKQSKDEPKLAVLLHELAVMSRDAALYGEVVDRVDGRVREDVYWGTRIYFLSALDRWQDVAGVLRGYVDAKRKSGEPYTREIQVHAYLAAALRLCGEDEEAGGHDQIVEQLYLGNPDFAVRIGEAYAFGRDYERAAQWWMRACSEGGAESSAFAKSIDSLATYWLEKGEWRKAASLSECLLRLYANPNLQVDSPNSFAQLRLQADTARALSLYDSQPDLAHGVLARSHRAYLSHGSLADVFFPSLRQAGVTRQYDEWFEETWKFMRGVIDLYPDSDNTRNTAAWIASRAMRELKQGEKDVAAALALRPDQAAYLDTMAEMQFSLGRRKAAIEWSRKAMKSKPDDAIIRSQYFRFLKAPLPR